MLLRQPALDSHLRFGRSGDRDVGMHREVPRNNAAKDKDPVTLRNLRSGLRV